jgi:hypothetical protein
MADEVVFDELPSIGPIPDVPIAPTVPVVDAVPVAPAPPVEIPAGTLPDSSLPVESLSPSEPGGGIFTPPQPGELNPPLPYPVAMDLAGALVLPPRPDAVAVESDAASEHAAQERLRDADYERDTGRRIDLVDGSIPEPPVVAIIVESVTQAILEALEQVGGGALEGGGLIPIPPEESE